MDDIVAELVASSSSSSESDNELELLFSSSDDEDFLKFQNNLFKRIKKNRVQNFVSDVVEKYSEDEFRRNFRVSRTVADKLINQFQSSSHYKTSKGGRVGVTAQSQCLAFLWFAGNKETYREVSNLFNISPSAAHTHLTNFLEFLFDISDQHIRFPSTESEMVQKSTAFAEIAGFPNVIGCIDGSYIYIRKPVNKVRSTYVNRHGLISITLQGICDANKKFIDVFIGSPSKIHDSRIYKLSYISEKIPTICGKTYHILGDAAYPLREFLLTPYKDYGNLTPNKTLYNKKHAQTRVKIENTFGLLKQRFRQLIRLDFFSVERMCKFVLGCCVLHNLCIENGDLWDENEPELQLEIATEAMLPDTRNTERTEENAGISEAVLKHLGENKRSLIRESF